MLGEPENPEDHSTNAFRKKPRRLSLKFALPQSDNARERLTLESVENSVMSGYWISGLIPVTISKAIRQCHIVILVAAFSDVGLLLGDPFGAQDSVEPYRAFHTVFSRELAIELIVYCPLSDQSVALRVVGIGASKAKLCSRHVIGL
jgi:hypothetical protein